MHNLDSDLLQEFRRSHFTSNRLALVGVGVRHDDLVRFADLFRLPAGKEFKRQPSKFISSKF